MLRTQTSSHATFFIILIYIRTVLCRISTNTIFPEKFKMFFRVVWQICNLKLFVGIKKVFQSIKKYELKKEFCKKHNFDFWGHRSFIILYNLQTYSFKYHILHLKWMKNYNGYARTIAPVTQPQTSKTVDFL